MNYPFGYPFMVEVSYLLPQNEIFEERWTTLSGTQ
jgi:hypothetical protein